MVTRAEVSQYVLVEIKKNDTDLLQGVAYRSGCWGVSEELSNAVTQTQKTVFDFTRRRFRDHLKDGYGNDTGQTVYAVEPRSFLVVGNLSQLAGNDDKIACFELFRRNTKAPEILTFDELFHRARCIVENISKDSDGVKEGVHSLTEEEGDEISFNKKRPTPQPKPLCLDRARLLSLSSPWP